jgi:hypothetical protein
MQTHFQAQAAVRASVSQSPKNIVSMVGCRGRSHLQSLSVALRMGLLGSRFISPLSIRLWALKTWKRAEKKTSCPQLCQGGRWFSLLYQINTLVMVER